MPPRIPWPPRSPVDSVAPPRFPRRPVRFPAASKVTKDPQAAPEVPRTVHARFPESVDISYYSPKASQCAPQGSREVFRRARPRQGVCGGPGDGARPTYGRGAPVRMDADKGLTTHGTDPPRNRRSFARTAKLAGGASGGICWCASHRLRTAARDPCMLCDQLGCAVIYHAGAWPRGMAHGTERQHHVRACAAAAT